MDTPRTPAPPASRADGSYPRPQLVRPLWRSLDGEWDFAYDDDRVGLDEGWSSGGAFDRQIVVPFPPESKASGVGDTGFHPVLWYRRVLTPQDLTAAGLGEQGERLLLHFGAVDHRADVWLDGHHLGSHEGGHTPFTFDVTADLDQGAGSWTLVVRAEDDPHDVGQPRGKQDWQLEPHGIWYDRTSGIWQPVWLEAVPVDHVTALAWTPDVPTGTVTLDLELARRPKRPVDVVITVRSREELLTSVRVRQSEPRSRTVVTLPGQSNGQAHEDLLWSPEHPHLLDATVELVGLEEGPDQGDRVSSYLGLRSVGFGDGHFLLNDRPRYLRAVLAQNYWPQSHLAAPDADALRREVELVLALGFNAARVHQKIEDPRFLYWADRLGLLLWEECPSSYEFSPTALQRTTREWTEVVRRDVSHPSIVVWVPFNESWGVQHVAHEPAQLDAVQALYHLTRALDPSRPVVSNDGWEHAESDLWTVHDYAGTYDELAAGYRGAAETAALLGGMGPAGRRMRLLDRPDRGQPVLVTEFGGVRYAPVSSEDTWGYTTVSDLGDYERALGELFSALVSSPVLAGFCYTQLTDTQQEANGLVDADRVPKLPLERIRAIVQGTAAPEPAAGS